MRDPLRLDIWTDSAGILAFLVKARSINIGVTVGAVAATMALSIVPAEHLHLSLQGRPVVHRHDITIAASHQPDSLFDHGDHRDVQVLQTVFESGPRFAIAPPFVCEDAAPIAPDWLFVRRIDALDARACHDPPHRLASLRAPPAEV